MFMAVPWVDPMDANRCDSEVLVKDDRWGGWTNRCRLMKGHGGYHRHPLDACDPKAFMAWMGTTDAPSIDPHQYNESFDAPSTVEGKATHEETWEAECAEFGCHEQETDQP